MNPALLKKINVNIIKNGGVNKLPSWFKQEIPKSIVLERARLLCRLNVHTVCQEARCPNLSSCFSELKFTFMILGNSCTRNCKFCAVNKTGQKKLDLDLDEPFRIADVIKKLGLGYVVLTSVTRDDLSDGGASVFAETLKLIHNLDSNIRVEILIPDFQGKVLSLETVLERKPNLVSHNIETVRRLYPDLRPLADYSLSLTILAKIKELRPEIITKSSLMLGLGETEEEIVEVMKDLRYSRLDILTLGQYLAPSSECYPVKEFISPEKFQRYREIGLGLGFVSVFAGPLVRSSYKAEEVYNDMNESMTNTKIQMTK